MDLTTVTLPSGSVYPAVSVGDGIFLTHPQLTVEELRDPYWEAILNAMCWEKNRRAVTAAANTNRVYRLPIGDSWLAPMSVHRGNGGEVIALVHNF